MVNLESIHEDFARNTSDNVNQWGDQSTVNLGRIHEDFARITSDNVDPGGVIDGNLESIHKDFARITSDKVDPGGDRWSTWEGSAKTLQGLPLTMLILGG